MTVLNQTKIEIDRLPPLPISAQIILQSINGEIIDLDELSKSIELDPPSTAKILSIANSAVFISTSKYSNVKDAVVRIGIDGVSSYLLPMLLASHFSTKPCPAFRLDLYWKKALLTALGLKVLCTCARNSMNPETVSAAYVAGLLHNIGILVLVHLFPDEMNKILADNHLSEKIISSLIQKELGISPSDAGQQLLVAWDLPKKIHEIPTHMYAKNNQSFLAELVKFVSDWYKDDFCLKTASQQLSKNGISDQHIFQAHSIIGKEKERYLTLSEMLYYC